MGTSPWRFQLLVLSSSRIVSSRALVRFAIMFSRSACNQHSSCDANTQFAEFILRAIAHVHSLVLFLLFSISPGWQRCCLFPRGLCYQYSSCDGNTLMI